MSGRRLSPSRSPLVSTIIPCYNYGRYLGEAIESTLAQAHDRIEVIVVDDGSTDDSREVASRFGPSVRVVSQPNLGISAARNRGVELATGEFLAFLDADDLWSADKLPVQLEAAEADPALGIVSGYAVQFASPDIAPGRLAGIRVDSRAMPARLASALLIRRTAFDRVGPFSTVYAAAECLDWYLRAAEQGVPDRMLSDVVLRRRIHDTNHGIVRRDTRHDYVRVFKASLDRRRMQEKGATG